MTKRVKIDIPCLTHSRHRHGVSRDVLRVKRHAQTGPLGVKAIGTSNIIPYGYMPIDICQFFVVNFTSNDPIAMCLALDHNNLLPPRLGNRIIPYGYMPIDMSIIW